MYDDKGYTIRRTYDYAVRSLELMEKYLGLNIHVHGDEGDYMRKGQIFLFNHFARFETLIPPYLIHRQTDAYCRSVADHRLFTSSKRLGKVLSDIGAVPNNLPGLLPFLAAEILRGRKVVIFPEGAMIKDRRVLDEEGEPGFFSQELQIFRKHHTGAAVLALTLEIFKRRIRDLFESNDSKRIHHWMTSLGLDSPEELLAQADKPTVIVPSTITFYPIRVSDTFLTRWAEYFDKEKKLPAHMLEELAIESNILFNKTDMDIRLGNPIQPMKSWRWWDTLLMRKYFLNIQSLDELFSLREVASTWVENLLVRTIVNESKRVRDKYMRAIYQGITINLSHLAASIISEIMTREESEISGQTLHQALYLTLKTLQKSAEVHLHRSLISPERYAGLIDGISEDLERFLNTCIQLELIRKTDDGYMLLSKLYQEHDFHEIRLQNPLMVYANEVAPIRAVGKAVKKSLAMVPWEDKSREIGQLLFDDELRAFQYNKNYYQRERFQKINKNETATASGKPFLLMGKSRAPMGILLVHGFLASPAELSAFGEKLNELGYAVMGVRLAGHGTSPWDLHHRRWEEWQHSLQRGYDILSCYADNIVIVGFSMGAALSLIFAAEKPAGLAGIACVATPYELQNKNANLAPLVHGVNSLIDRFSHGGGIIPFHDNDPTYPDINYRSMPISALHELLSMITVMKSKLELVDVPACIIQGEEDDVVTPESAQYIHDELVNCNNKVLHWIPQGPHCLITGDLGDTHSCLLAFIASLVKTEEISENTEPLEQAET